MPTRRTILLVAALAPACAPLLAPPAARALDHGDGGATPAASHAATRPGTGGTGAAYLTIRNAGTAPDRLLGGETDRAHAVEIHQVSADGDVMRMRPLPDGLEIPAGAEVVAEPGGYHVMLFGLTEDLRNGDRYDLVLRFERAGEVAVPVDVRPRAETASDESRQPVVVGDLTIANAWSRPAPALDGATPEAATPTP